jgi:hypothetical protein
MRFTDINIKIGINLYGSTTRDAREEDVGVDGTPVVTGAKIIDYTLKSNTLVFESFVKKATLTVKPEYQSVVENPRLPRKEQISLEKFYDIDFEVLSESKEEAIENYNKLLTLIEHLYYIQTRNDGSPLPNRFGNVGVIFKGNPPIFTGNVRGFHGIDKVKDGFAKEYEAIFTAENFNYNIDLDKGYILVPSNLIRGFKKDNNDETLIPVAFSIVLNGTCVENRYKVESQSPAASLPAAPNATDTTKTAEQKGGDGSVAESIEFNYEDLKRELISYFNNIFSSNNSTNQTIVDSILADPVKKAALLNLINTSNGTLAERISATGTSIAKLNSLTAAATTTQTAGTSGTVTSTEAQQTPSTQIYTLPSSEKLTSILRDSGITSETDSQNNTVFKASQTLYESIKKQLSTEQSFFDSVYESARSKFGK